MSPTRSHSETIRECLVSKEFRREFLRLAVNDMLEGDLDTAKSILREYINGTVGFIALGEALAKSPKSLMRMFSVTGNPQARNLFEIIAYLQKIDGTTLEVRVKKTKAA